MQNYKTGDRVNITDDIPALDIRGRSGTIQRLSCPASKADSGLDCWWVIVDDGPTRSLSEKYLTHQGAEEPSDMIGKRFKVKLGHQSVHEGHYGVITGFNRQSPTGRRYWYTKLDNGVPVSYAESVIEFVTERSEVITLAMVTEAKEKVDKAQRDFVELLSRYQVQEASK